MPFEKGKSGNPGGRFRIDPVVKEFLKDATMPAAKALVDALQAMRPVVVSEGMNRGSTIVEVPDHDARIKAANAIMDRLYGKPTQEVSGPDGGPIQLEAQGEMLRTIFKRLASDPPKEGT